ncbi:hypothetical protein BEWA_022520 [Theileria equi strain WA]|uniref:Uncharacterized protein n=1 Tax=Theileria equi strain WA TaxID=1537102 RepID=L0AX02_THEEQ|nr:hypothetical protein BEWA_022520 [Theileria equi strain WA]AFZ79404.1 hypothetical protein BEWA_022520 [Theileria equi strain WA]|eukprot:XP_004829070.1 hypothetical protein BEWA_022520 [Theileria equi strain WA]
MTDRVTIELKNKPTADGTEEYPGTSTSGKTVNITVERTTYPTGSDFYRYEHTLRTGGQQFTLKEVRDDQNKEINAINDLKGQEVTSVAAYYWKHENGTNSTPTTALMVEVTATGTKTKNKTTYYANVKNNGSNEWIKLYGGSRPNLINGDIERTLDDLVCSNYGGVTIDLSKSTSMSGRASNGEPYCCRCHGEDKDKSSDQRKITVKQQNVSCKHKKANYYKHTIIGNHELARIRYYLTFPNNPTSTDTNKPSNRRRIKLGDKAFPLTDVEAVYAFYCGGNPVLIYVKGDGNNGTNSWYKKPTDGSNHNGDEEWTSVPNLNIKPSELTNHTDCKKYNKLIEELRTVECVGLQKCTESAQQSSQAATEPMGPVGNKGEEGKADGSEAKAQDGVGPGGGKGESGPPGASGGQNSDTGDGENGEDTPDSPKAAEFGTGAAEAGIFATIGYFFAGTTGSGLTGFLGYKGYKLYQNFKGDPWVRQI